MKSSKKENNDAINAAVKAISTYPSQAALAREFGMERATIGSWKKTGVPIKHCPKMELLTGVPKEKLRPEFFG